MITTIRFIVIVIIRHEKRRIRRKRIDHTTARRIAAILIIHEPLGVHGFFLRKTCIRGILGIKIPVGIDAIPLFFVILFPFQTPQ